MLKVSRLFFVLFIVVFGVSLYLFYATLFPLFPSGQEVELVIPKGTSAYKVTQELHHKNVISRPFLFKVLLRLTGGNKKVRAGEFAFEKNMSLFKAMWQLYYADPIMYKLVIPEGYNHWQIADLIEANELGNKEKFIELTSSQKTAKKYKFKTPHMEGFLFPDTYYFSKSDREEKIIASFVQRFHEKTKPLIKQVTEQGWSLEDWVTLASIIEKETGQASERPLIAAVFLNRLKKKMRLQSDPTTIYGLRKFDKRLRKKDLQTHTPYNTYTIRALPIGPIANPGLESLKAVLNPKDSDYLYFVSTNQGYHKFSKTYREHNDYVDIYQRGKKPKRKP